MMSDLLNYLIGLNRIEKRVVLSLVDAVLLTISFALALTLRLESLFFSLAAESWIAFGTILPVTILVFRRLGLYRAVVRHVAGETVRVLALGLAISAALLLAVAQGFGLFLPRSVPIIFGLLSLGCLSGARFGLRAVYRQRQARLKKPVIIYGAGSAGRQLLVSLEHGGDYAPVAFVDDATEIQGRDLGGYRVYPPARLSQIAAEYDAQSVLLAFPRLRVCSAKRSLSDWSR